MLREKTDLAVSVIFKCRFSSQDVLINTEDSSLEKKLGKGN